MPASVISVYCAYVCYTGLSSEPRDYVCNGLNKSKAVTTSTLVLGMLTTVLSVLYSALRAGSSTTFLSPPSSPRSGTKTSLCSYYFFCSSVNDLRFVNPFSQFMKIPVISLSKKKKWIFLWFVWLLSILTKMGGDDI